MKIGPNSLSIWPHVESRRGNGVSQETKEEARTFETTSSSVWHHLTILSNINANVMLRNADLRWSKKSTVEGHRKVL